MCLVIALHTHIVCIFSYTIVIIIFYLYNTLPALCHCPPHTGLSIKHRLPISTDISWKPLPEGEQNTVITGYTVQVVGADTKCEISVTDANATSVVVPNLRPSTSYTFNVCATTKAGKGPIATITSTTPKGEPAKQPDVSIDYSTSQLFL